MRVIFCGSGSFAVPVLDAVAASRHEISIIVTQPARPAGRGGKLRPTPVSEAAPRHGLTACECANINTADAVGLLRDAVADVMCVVDFGQMIRKDARDAARTGAFNLHGSVLPELRGAAPVNWAIIRGHKTTGVTTFHLVDKMDAGPVYLTAATEISPDETADQLRARLAAIGAQLVLDTLDLLERGDAQPAPQDDAKATLAPRLTKADGAIGWAEPAEAIRNRIHGTWSWPGAHATLRRHDAKCLDVTIARAAVEPGAPADAGPGSVLADGSIAAGAGRLRILQIKPAGGRLMQWRDFVNGYRVGEGDRFV